MMGTKGEGEGKRAGQLFVVVGPLVVLSEPSVSRRVAASVTFSISDFFS